MNNFRGDLTDISAKKEALVLKAPLLTPEWIAALTITGLAV